MLLLQGMNESSLGQPWVIWHHSIGASSHGSQGQDACCKGLHPWVLPITLSVTQVRGHLQNAGVRTAISTHPTLSAWPILKAQSEEGTLTSGVHPQLESPNACMVPPSPLWETKKTIKQDNTEIQPLKKIARAGTCCLYLHLLVHTPLSVPRHKHGCFTHWVLQI